MHQRNSSTHAQSPWRTEPGCVAWKAGSLCLGCGEDWGFPYLITPSQPMAPLPLGWSAGGSRGEQSSPDRRPPQCLSQQRPWGQVRPSSQAHISSHERTSALGPGGLVTELHCVPGSSCRGGLPTLPRFPSPKAQHHRVEEPEGTSLRLLAQAPGQPSGGGAPARAPPLLLPTCVPWGPARPWHPCSQQVARSLP